MNTLFFTGFVGVGKTSIARMVAARKDFNFVDVDESIMKNLNKTKIEIYRPENKNLYIAEFNKLIFDLSPYNTVVALGFDSLLYSEGVKNTIKKIGKTIHLKSDYDKIISNLNDKLFEHPYICNDNSKEFIDELILARKNGYDEIANTTITIDKLSLQDVFHKSLYYYNNLNKLSCHILIK